MTGSLVIAALLSGCSTVKVRKETGAVIRDGINAAEKLRKSPLLRHPHDALAEVGDTCASLMKDARRQESLGKKRDAASCYLKASVYAREQIEAGNFGPTEETREDLVELHNKALARFAELWAVDPHRWEEGPHLFTCGDETFQIELAPGSDYPKLYFDRAIATDSLRGEGVVDTHRRGFGASLVGIREALPEREEEFEYYAGKYGKGLHLPVTLTVSDIRTGGSGESYRKIVYISLLDPTQRQSVTVGGTRFPLAADFSAPLELALKGKNETLWGLSGYLNAKKRAKQSGIFLVEPYDPDRIPVVLSHGLISVPIIWRDIIPEFLSEPDIAKRYQFLVFTYPSSYPVMESAQLMRRELAGLRAKYDPEGDDPLSTNLVAMGHSMGGILTHMLVAENLGDYFWAELADVPLDELPIEKERRDSIRSLVYFSADPAARRAVFLSTPHRGADMATMGLADAISRLARFPIDVVATTAAITQGPPIPGIKVDMGKKITSVQSLRPDSPIALAMDKAPYRRGVVYHSIIGDQGKGDTPDSSDGVVAYWSSHQEGAASELIVPTDHGSYKDPGAIAELKRILRVHAGL